MPDRTNTSQHALVVGAQAATADNSSPNRAIEFYHQRVFYHFEETYYERLRTALHEVPAEFRKKTFLPQLSPSQVYRGPPAWEICYRYLNSIEGEMARVLGRHSVFFWVHLYRRIGVKLSPLSGGKTDANTLALVRQIAELAISKYGDLTRHDDVALSSEIHFKNVLGGHYRRLWLKWLKPPEAAKMFRALAETKQWVLTQFELRDYIDIYLVEGYAYEYWRVTALMRAIGKGSGFVVGADDWLNRTETAQLTELIESYDARIRGIPFSTALLGSWFHLSLRPGSLKNAMLTPFYNVERRNPFGEVTAFGEHPVPDSFVSNFLIGGIDIDAFHNAHAFLAEAFMQATGVSLSIYLLCLWALANIALLPPRVLFEAGENEAKFFDPNGPVFMNFVNLLQRAYITFDRALLIDEILFRAEAFAGNTPAPTRAEIATCVEQLVLSEEKRNQIALWSGGRRFPLVPFERALVVDLQGIPSLLESLFYRIQYKQTARGSVFEEAFRAALATEGFEQPHVGEIIASAGEKREIDASVRIADHLIIFECRSIERPLDYELGRPKTLEVRRAFLDQKVDQAMSLREFIVIHPNGRNYDFRWAKNISTFVVSPFIEWIWDRSARLWHDNHTPRILQADEAISYLRRLSDRKAPGP